MDKIYIIEDDQTIRNEIKQQSPDLIVMDITLPF